MADFTSAQIGQRAEAAQGFSPVQRPSPIAAGISALAGIMPSGEQLQARREAEREQQTASVVDQFRQESLRIADAVDRGEMSSATGRMRQRALFSRYTSDNPLIASDLTKTHSDLVKTVGMSKVLVEGNEQEQQQRALVQEAINRKWATPDMTEAQLADATARLREFDLNQEFIKDAQARQTLLNSQLSEQSSRLSISNAQIEQRRKLIGLEMDRNKLEAQNAVYAMANSYGPTNVAHLEDILKRAEGAPPEVRRALMLELDNLEAQTVGDIQRALGPGGSGDQLSYALKPLQTRIDSARSILDGSADRTTWENAVNLTMTQEKFQMLQDPATRAAVATTNLFGEQVAMSGVINAQALKWYAQAVNGAQPNVVPATVDSQGLRDTQAYLDSVKAVANAANSQQLTEASMRELETNIDAIMGSVADAYRRPATSFNTVAQALSSPEMGRYISEHGSVLTTENALAAKDVFRTQYADVILPLIQDEWQTTYEDWKVSGPELERRGVIPSNLRAREERDVRGDIRVEWSGGGVSFRTDRNLGSMGRTKLNQLNQRLAGPINNLIRLGAHLEGHTNYRKFYEENYAGIFDTAGTEEGNVE